MELETATEIKRDLIADLAICDAATGGKWEWHDGKRHDLGSIVSDTEGSVCFFGNNTTYYPLEGEEPTEEDITFMTEAREGWAHAIRRAIAAEAENERLNGKIAVLRVAYDNLEIENDELAESYVGGLLREVVECVARVSVILTEHIAFIAKCILR